MENFISETEIQAIISNFDASITEYEIIDMDKYQGWSSKYLYLLVSPEDNFILKAKTFDQIAGYDNEVTICRALNENGIQARSPILTKNGDIFYEQCGYYWCLMTFIPGAPSHVNEYNENTVKSLAEHINQYIVASLVNENMKNLNIKQPLAQDESHVFDKFITEKKTLESLGILKSNEIFELYKSIKDGNNKFSQNFLIKSIIHNDINPRNILIDHKSKNVISLIDWDHVCYGNPLKDVSDAVSIFYDNLSLDKAKEYKKLFYQSIKSTWFTDIKSSLVEYALLYYFTIAKWQAILFYLELLRKYDNNYGERDRFISEMKQIFIKWLKLVKIFSV